MRAHDLSIPPVNRWAAALLTACLALTAQANTQPAAATAGAVAG